LAEAVRVGDGRRRREREKSGRGRGEEARAVPQYRDFFVFFGLFFSCCLGRGLTGLPALSHTNRGCRLATGGRSTLERDTRFQVSPPRQAFQLNPFGRFHPRKIPLPLLTPRHVTSDDTRDIRNDIQSPGSRRVRFFPTRLRTAASPIPDRLSDCLRRYPLDTLGGPGRPASPGAVGRFLACSRGACFVTLA
jgi:hypothetical protein